MNNNNLISVQPYHAGKRCILMVALPSVEDKYRQSPLGHTSLVATLRADAALDVRELVYPVSADDHSVIGLEQCLFAKLSACQADSVDVAIGVYIWNDVHVRKLLVLLREGGFRGRIILGGPQITYADAGLEKLYPKADIFVRGYAEQSLLEAVTSDDRKVIPGVHYAGHHDSCGQAKVAIEGLPSPWLSGINNIDAMESVRWETQRGCNFNCSFCQHRQADAKAKPFTLANSRIADEIALFCKKGVPKINVLDPVFNMKKDHSLWVLTEFIKHGYKGQLSLQCRAEMLNEEFFALAAKLDVCLEFGLQSIVKEEYMAVDRPNNLASIEKWLAAVKRHKIRHEVSIIYGLPNQTLESFKQTVGWCLTMEIPVIKAFPLLLLRGTRLDKDRAEWGLEVSDENFPSVIRSNTFNESDWQEMEKIASALVISEGRHPATVADLAIVGGNQNYCVKNSLQRALGK